MEGEGFFFKRIEGFKVTRREVIEGKDCETSFKKKRKTKFEENGRGRGRDACEFFFIDFALLLLTAGKFKF